MRRERNDHGFDAIAVRGGILPPAFLSTIAALKAPNQTGADYGLSKSLSIKDEIARYWRISTDLFSAYTERRARADLDQRKVGVEEWLVVLLRDIFGYTDLQPVRPILSGDRSFPITHSAYNDTVPFVLTTSDNDLDRADARFGDMGRRRAPQNLLQELLNADELHTWGIISNGVNLRLLRDNPSLSRPAYVEVDLERIFREQQYADFAALWLLLHASRLKPIAGKTSASILELWRERAHEEGERARGQLRNGVTQAVLTLGNGFLQNPLNENLLTSITTGAISAESYFQELLRLVYRLLFLFAAEERHVLHPPSAVEESRDLYRLGYSMARLRQRAQRHRHYDRHGDLWSGLRIVFQGLATGQPALGLPALGGLFSVEQCRHLDSSRIDNARLLEAVSMLAFLRGAAGISVVNYRDMGAEELGSVYESLLELQPILKVGTRPWSFELLGSESREIAKGSARKLTGSYYTPAPLVNELIKSALEPTMADALARRSAETEAHCLI